MTIAETEAADCPLVVYDAENMGNLSVTAALRTARAALERARAEVANLETEVRGLEFAQARERGQALPATAPTTSQRNGTSSISRTEAILQALAQRGEPMRPRDLVQAVGEIRGLEEGQHDIGAALNYLKKMRKVESPERGMWRLVQPSPADLIRNGVPVGVGDHPTWPAPSLSPPAMSSSPNPPAPSSSVGEIDPDDIPF